MYCAVGLGTLVLCDQSSRLFHNASSKLHPLPSPLCPVFVPGIPPAGRLTALSFQGWLHSFSGMSSRLDHIAVCSRLYFLLETEDYSWCSWTTAGLSVCGSMDCIHLPAVVCNNAFNTTVLVGFGAAIVYRKA